MFTHIYYKNIGPNNTIVFNNLAVKEEKHERINSSLSLLKHLGKVDASVNVSLRFSMLNEIVFQRNDNSFFQQLV